MIYGVIDGYQLLWLAALGADPLMIGAAVFELYMCEIPMFYRCGALYERFGMRALLVAATLCYVVRLVGLALLPSPLWVLLVMPLQSFSYTICEGAIAPYVAEVVLESGAPRLRTVAQGARIFVLYGGRTIGYVAGGVLIDRVGFHAAWLWTATLGVPALALLVIGGAAAPVRRRHAQEPEPSEADPLLVPLVAPGSDEAPP